MSGGGRIAYVGLDGQIHAVDPDGEGRSQVTFSKAMGHLAAWGGSAGTDTHAWPCWSPDDSWLAVFQSAGDPDEQGLTTVSVVQVDGVEERQLLSLEESQPIYVRWSPSGERLAVLTQEEDLLVLHRAEVGDVGRAHEVVRGVPLFFCWADEDRLAVHVGDKRTGVGRVLLDGLGERTSVTDRPGSFCTPLSVGHDLVYALGRGRRSRISLSDRRTGRRRDLTELEGLLALVGPPRHQPEGPLLVSAAPGGEHTPYDGVWLLDRATGLLQRAVDEPVMAFQWDPTGARVVFTVLDAERSRMAFRTWEAATGRIREICTLWPSRDQLFYLHFFEQFAESHPLVSPDGRTLVFSGYPDPRHAREDDAGPVIHVVDLVEPTGGALPLAEGRFAVFSNS